jgi:DNA-binding NarL/FixJ family response regulator
MKFALVEDQVMFRSLLRQLLVAECRGQIAFEVGSLAELRANIAMLSTVDLLLLDIRLPDGDGFDFLEDLTRQHLSVPVLLLSSSCEDYVVHRVSRSFVQGFVHKDEDTKILLTAVQMITAGGAFFSPRFTERKRALMHADGSFDKKLSAREQEVLGLIGAGFSDAEVAATLGISASTAQTHRRNVMGKLDLHTMQDIQTYALKTGFTTTDRLK